ncbi:Uma2 family endonuclease [bacterium]|nr:Uma2 family endonuclease [bacterium]
MVLPKLDQTYTYADYLEWPDEERWELLDGQPVMMVPSPGTTHQKLARNLTRLLGNVLVGHPCQLFPAPMDVVLSQANVVQPDVFIVCEADKILEHAIQGAPDVIFEILSPSSQKLDRAEKRDLYERYGVKEYCIVDPALKLVEMYRLATNGFYQKSQILDENEKLELASLPGITLQLQEVFETQQASNNNPA